MHNIVSIVLFSDIRPEAYPVIHYFRDGIYLIIRTGMPCNHNVGSNNIIIAQHRCELMIRPNHFLQMSKMLILHKAGRFNRICIAQIFNHPFSRSQMLKLRECPPYKFTHHIFKNATCRLRGKFLP